MEEDEDDDDHLGLDSAGKGDLLRKLRNARHVASFHEKAAREAAERQAEAERIASESTRRLSRALEVIDALRRRERIRALRDELGSMEDSVRNAEVELRASRAESAVNPHSSLSRRKVHRAEHSLESKSRDLQSGCELLSSLLRREELQEKLHSACSLGDLSQVRNLLAVADQESCSAGREKTSGKSLPLDRTSYDVCINEPEGGGYKDAGLSPLHAACAAGHTEIVQFLIEFGGDVENSCSGGLTPLALAANRGHLEVTHALLSEGARLDRKDDGGRTPLHLAATKGESDIVKLLLERGADANARDDHGDTPLILAVRSGRAGAVAVIRHLLLYEAGTDFRDASGKIALDLALEKSEMNLVRALLGKEAYDEVGEVVAQVM